MARRRQLDSTQDLIKILEASFGGSNKVKKRDKTHRHTNDQRNNQETSNARNKNKKQKGRNPGREGGHGSSGRNNKWNLALPHVANFNAHNFPSPGFEKRRNSVLEKFWSVIDRQFPDPPDPGIDPSDDLAIPDADQFSAEIDLQSTCIDLSWTLLTLHDRLCNIQLLQQISQSLFGPKSSVVMGAAILDQFLAGIADLVSRRQGDRLQDFLQIVPRNMGESYRYMADELQATYPKGQGDEALLKRCEALVGKTSDGSTAWPAFPIFIRSYLAYLRDGNVSDSLEAHNSLSLLLK